MDQRWNRILIALPVTVVLLHAASCLVGMAVDWWIAHLWVQSIATVIAGIAVWKVRDTSDAAPLWWVGLGMAWLLLLAVHGTGVPPSPTLRLACVALDAGALLVSLAMAGARFEVAVRSLGAGMCLAVLAAMGLSLALGHPHVGLGMMNHVLAFGLPCIVAWIAMDWDGMGRPARLAIGLAIMAILAWMWSGHPDGPRRAGVLALTVGLASPWLLTVLRARQWLMVGAVVGLAVLIAASWSWAIAQDVGQEFRTQRVGIWRASWEGIAAWWPLGGGVWSSLRLSDLPTDAARLVSSGNAAFDHPHNEYLAVLQDQGLAGILIALCATALVVVPVLRLPRIPARHGAVALMVSTGVFLLLDNAYSMPACRIMLGATAGVLVAAGRLGGERVRTRNLGRPLAMMVSGGGVLVAAWSVWCETPAAAASRSSPTNDLVQAVRETNQPQVSGLLVGMVVQRLVQHPSDELLGQADVVSRIALDRIGPDPGLIRWRYQTVCCLADRFLQPPPGQRQAYGIRLLTDEVCAMAQSVLHADPFMLQPYQAVAAIDRLGYADRADQRVVMRARVLSGRLEWVVPPEPPYDGLEAQTDAWVYLTSRLAGRWSPDDHVRMGALLTSAIGVRGVQVLAASAAAADPAGSAVWSSRHCRALRAVGVDLSR